MTDINRDGKVDHQDLAMLRELVETYGGQPELLAELSTDERAMLDVNGDGELNYDDVVRLCNRLLGGKADQATAMADKLASLRNKLR